MLKLHACLVVLELSPFVMGFRKKAEVKSALTSSLCVGTNETLLLLVDKLPSEEVI